MVCLNQAGHGARDTSRERTLVRERGRVAPAVEIHVVGRPPRRGFTIVEGCCGPIRHPEDHEPAAAEVSGLRVNHGERETNGDSRIYRVPAGLENAPSYLTGDRAAGDHHCPGPEGHPGFAIERPRRIDPDSNRRTDRRGWPRRWCMTAPGRESKGK